METPSSDTRKTIENALGYEETLLAALLYCAKYHYPYGLDTPIDVLENHPEQIVKVIRLIQNRFKRWFLQSGAEADIWYVLLRALARSKYPEEEKYPLIEIGLTGSFHIKDGSLRALADMATDKAKEIIGSFAQDPCGSTRALVAELLGEWDDYVETAKERNAG